MARKSSLGVLDAKTSESTKVVKGALDASAKKKIFGGTQLSVPEGTPMLSLLKLLNEE